MAYAKTQLGICFLRPERAAKLLGVVAALFLAYSFGTSSLLSSWQHQQQLWDETSSREVTNNNNNEQQHPVKRCNPVRTALHSASADKNGVFCIDQNSLNHHNFFPNLCRGLEAIMEKGSSVLDLGAAYGYFGRCLLRKKEYMLPAPQGRAIEEKDYFLKMNMSGLWDVPRKVESFEAYDGTPNIEEITSGFVKYTDLTQPFRLNRTFDWVITFEVAEHIPPQYEQIFLQNLLFHVGTGLVISWCDRTYRKSDVHINLKNNSEVMPIFTDMGMIWRPDLQAKLRSHLKLSLTVNTKEPAYRRHLMVFTWN